MKSYKSSMYNGGPVGNALFRLTGDSLHIDTASHALVMERLRYTVK